MRPRGAIVVGGYVNGLGVLRALAARNIPAAVVCTKAYDIASHSRAASAHAALLEIEEQPERLVELLDRRRREWDGWAIFPTNDGALAAVSRYHEQLSSHFRLVAPSPEAVRQLLDKDLLLSAARASGVDVPHCYGPANAETADTADVRFPVLVKPTVGYRFVSRFGCKLFVARDRGELQQSVARMSAAGFDGGVFDFIPGADAQIYAYCIYIDAHGEPRGGLTVHKLRQSPPLFGVARVAEIVADVPALREAMIDVLRRIGFRGMAAAEFKLDPRDGRFRLLEINGRSVIYNALLRRGGLDLTGQAWAEHADGQTESLRPDGWPGVWLHLHADVLYSWLYRRRYPMSWSDFIAPYRRPRVFAVWSARDPLPFLAQWWGTVAAGASALRRGKHRELLADRAPPVIDVRS